MEQQILNKKQLLKATLVAIVLGALVLVTAVLPAEYGIDPTGAGKTLGFSKLYIENDDDTSETLPVTDENRPVIRLEKAGSGPDVAVPSEAFSPAPDTQYSERTDEVMVTVPAGKGIEYKINVLKYGKVKYEWLTNSGVLYFDFHGEVKQKIKPEQVYFESYTIAYSNNMVGTFLAPFEGKHGWYFRNSSDKDITVNLRLKGQYVL
jgi:hypothetical protein|uniref:hypothetical protein n=1 Tax=Roseivirga sp. TaxID=1964215 RepID=UPI004048404B